MDIQSHWQTQNTVVTLKGVINNVAAGDTFTVDDANYTVLDVDADNNSVIAAVDGTPVESLGQTVTISDDKTIEGIDGNAIESEQLFLISGISTANDISVEGNTVTISASNLNGETVTLTNSGSNNYTLALGTDVPTTAHTATDADAFEPIWNHAFE